MGKRGKLEEEMWREKKCGERGFSANLNTSMVDDVHFSAYKHNTLIFLYPVSSCFTNSEPTLTYFPFPADIVTR